MVYQSLFLTIGLNHQFVITYFSFFFYKRLQKRYETNTYFLNFEKTLQEPFLNVKLLESAGVILFNDKPTNLPTIRLNNSTMYMGTFISGLNLVHSTNSLKNQLLFSYWSLLKQSLTLKKLKKTKINLSLLFNYGFYYYYNFPKIYLTVKYQYIQTNFYKVRYTFCIHKINFLTCSI